MPQTADNLARENQLSREECDVFALGSQQKYAKAGKDGFFKGEIRPVSLPQAKGKPDVVVSADEHPRPETTMETLQKLKPLFADGVTTAGNASGINDGAAALVARAAMRWLQGRRQADGADRLWPWRAAAHHGLRSGAGGEQAAASAGLELKDMDVIEINEAFAAQVLGCLKGLGLPLNDARA